MEKLLALDVGARRIGIAKCDGTVRLAYPLTTVSVDGSELTALKTLVEQECPEKLVVGFPRNQAGERTLQTEAVEVFADRLKVLGVPIVFQDESVTSVLAEQQLEERNKPYTKDMIDSEAAALLLQDYLEITYGQ